MANAAAEPPYAMRIVPVRSLPFAATQKRFDQGWVRCGRERYVVRPRKQSRCRVYCYPSGARQDDIGPRMKGCRVGAQRFIPHLGGEFYQVSGDKAGRKSQAPRGLDEQPSAVATRPGAFAERGLNVLYARVKPTGVANRGGDLLRGVRQKRNR